MIGVISHVRLFVLINECQIILHRVFLAGCCTAQGIGGVVRLIGCSAPHHSMNQPLTERERGKRRRRGTYPFD